MVLPEQFTSNKVGVATPRVLVCVYIMADDSYGRHVILHNTAWQGAWQWVTQLWHHVTTLSILTAQSWQQTATNIPQIPHHPTRGKICITPTNINQTNMNWFFYKLKRFFGTLSTLVGKWNKEHKSSDGCRSVSQTIIIWHVKLGRGGEVSQPTGLLNRVPVQWKVCNWRNNIFARITPA